MGRTVQRLKHKKKEQMCTCLLFDIFHQKKYFRLDYILYGETINFVNLCLVFFKPIYANILGYCLTSHCKV